jgi:hypothetical protein
MCMNQKNHLLSFLSNNHTLSSDTTTIYMQQLAHHNSNIINISPTYQRTHHIYASNANMTAHQETFEMTPIESKMRRK